MKHISIVLFAIVMFSGCVTQRRCLVKFPPDTVTKYETKTSIQWRDTVVFVRVKSDSTFVNDYMTVDYVPKPINQTDTILVPIINIPKLTARLPLAHSTAWVDEGLLNLGLWIDSTTLRFKLDSAMATVTDSVIIEHTNIIQVPAPVPKRYTIAIWALAGGVIVLLILALVLFKLK